MGRRVGVSQAGAGDTQPAKGDPAGDAASDPVLGKRTLRLAAQLQRVRVEHNDSEQDEGTPKRSMPPRVRRLRGWTTKPSPPGHAQPLKSPWMRSRCLWPTVQRSKILSDRAREGE